MNRLQAALIHLAISAAVGASIAAALLVVWYPPPYFAAAGALDLTVVILGVDLVLGPLLTLVVFRVGKPSLKFDLSIIALVQASALVYGLSVVVESRPVYLVGAVDRLQLVSANEVFIDPSTPPKYRQLPWLRPQLVAAPPPMSAKAKSRLLEELMAGLPDVELRPAFYRPYRDFAADIYARSQPLGDLVHARPESRATVNRWLRRHSIEMAEARYVPLVLRERDIVMVLDPATHHPIAPLDLEPIWSPTHSVSRHETDQSDGLRHPRQE